MRQQRQRQVAALPRCLSSRASLQVQQHHRLNQQLTPPHGLALQWQQLQRSPAAPAQRQRRTMLRQYLQSLQRQSPPWQHCPAAVAWPSQLKSVVAAAALVHCLTTLQLQPKQKQSRQQWSQVLRTQLAAPAQRSQQEQQEQQVAQLSWRCASLRLLQH